MKIISDIKGGLGNQLFSYVFGYALSKEKNAELILDVSMLKAGKINNRELEIDKFGISCDKIITIPYSDNFFMRKSGINRLVKRSIIGFTTKVYKEKQECVYDPDVMKCKGNTYFDGFWQSYRYFDKYREDILKMIRPKAKPSSVVEELSAKMQQEASVSLHVRRGDYAGMHWLLPMEYYDRAIEKLMEIGKEVSCVYVFSDDMDFSREYFEKKAYEDIRFEYVDYDDKDRTIYDMYLMSKCRHHIIANSSYSWWGAYLGEDEDRVVICPKTGMWGDDFYPDEWVKIEL